MSFSTDISEQSRRGYVDQTMNTNRLIWNASLSQRLLRKRTLTLSVRALDILNQRDNISRSISATQRTDSRSEMVNSYVLFSVQWRFGKFGGRGQGRMRGEGGERIRENGDGPRGERPEGERGGGGRNGGDGPRGGGFNGGRF